MTGSRAVRRLLLLLCALVLAVAVAGCGKKNSPRPLKGEEGAYTYPRVYPNPAGVLPAEAEAPEEPEAPDQKSIIFFPKSRTTTIYDSSVPPHSSVPQ